MKFTYFIVQKLYQIVSNQLIFFRTLIKNLLLGYLSSSAADKSSVLRVFSTVLEFSEAEKDKAGLNNAVSQNSWFSRLSSGSTIPNKVT